MNAIIVGSTGLIGSAFLRKALTSETVNEVWSFSRSDLPATIESSDKLRKVVTPGVKSWEDQFPRDASVMLSGIATTKADAGGLEKQKLVDHDLQVALAKAAKARGCKCFVLISSTGANAQSRLGYFKMKGETEKAIVNVGFEKTIILRPGPLLGKRSKPHGGRGEMLIQTVLPWFHRSRLQALMQYPVYDTEIADFVFKAIDQLQNGVHYIESRDILEDKLGSK